MIIRNVFVCCLIFIVASSLSSKAWGEETIKIPLESLLGKYEGTMQVHWKIPLNYDYQTEITSIDNAANTLSLIAQCQKCETKEWKRTNCKITEAKDTVKFVCKGKTSDEEYTANGNTLRATGSGKSPYSISVSKITK